MFLKQSTTINVKLGPALDRTDGVTEETALSPTVELSKAGGTFAARNSATAIAHDSNGWYTVELNATDTNTVGPLIAKFDDSATHLPVWHVYTVLAANVYDSIVGITDILDVSVTQWLGTAAATPTVAGVPEVDVTHWIGTAAATPTVAGVPETDTTHWNGTAVATPDTAGHPKVTIKDGAGAGEINLTAGAVDTVTAVTNAVTVGTINAGVITATAIATGAIDADAIAADAVTEIRSVASGTAQSGSTTTLVDTARTEADTDYWKGSTLLITSGTIAGQERLITAFNPATDTITVDRAFTQAVGTNTYQILPGGPALLAETTHTNAVVPTTTAVTNPVTVGTINANVITATSIAADAITAAKVADGTIDAATFAAGAINAAAIATGAVDADALATDAVNEIRDAVWAQVMSELGAVPGVTGTTLQALEWLFLLGRNKRTCTATTETLRNDADTVSIATAAVSDDATTATRAEWV